MILQDREMRRLLVTVALWLGVCGCGEDGEGTQPATMFDPASPQVGADPRALCVEVGESYCDRHQQCGLFLRLITPAQALDYFDDCLAAVTADCPRVRAIGGSVDDCIDDMPSASCEIRVQSNGRQILDVTLPSSCQGVLR